MTIETLIIRSSHDKKLFILCTHGPEDAERATIPFAMATAAQASDVEVVMGFQAEGVKLATKDSLGKVFAPTSHLLPIWSLPIRKRVERCLSADLA